MISLVAMTDRIRTKLVKDRRTIKSLKAKLVVSRRANARLRLRLGVETRHRALAVKQLREFRKKQLPLPLEVKP